MGVERPHPIHWDRQKFTLATFSLEYNHIVTQMKGLMELSMSPYVPSVKMYQGGVSP